MKVRLFLGPMNGRVVEIPRLTPEIVLRAKPRLEHYSLKFALLFPDARKTFVRYGYLGNDPRDDLPYYGFIDNDAE